MIRKIAPWPLWSDLSCQIFESIIHQVNKLKNFLVIVYVLLVFFVRSLQSRVGLYFAPITITKRNHHHKFAVLHYGKDTFWSFIALFTISRFCLINFKEKSYMTIYSSWCGCKIQMIIITVHSVESWTTNIFLQANYKI